VSLPDKETPKVGLVTAICIIAANMIGTGVFTSLGFQVMGIHSVSALLLLWVTGGIVAICGALTYAELAVSMPRSGGEYRYLSNLYHPSLGFLSGWVSATLGFAGPVAIAAMAFGEYFSNVIPGTDPNILATILLVGITIINIASIKAGTGFQTIFTLINLSLIIIIIICGFILPDHSHFHMTFTSNDLKQAESEDFFVSLVYVSFAYSGWNSATYIAEEIKNPKKNLPRALFLGSFIVMILYLLLNFIFLYSTPIPQLSGQLQVGFIAAKNIFGQDGALIIAVIISIGLIASVNSMMFTGPRVTRAIGEDFPFFGKLAHLNSKGSPVYAILLQFLIALILIYISNPNEVMTYLGFTLSLFTTLTVAGVFINRYRNKSLFVSPNNINARSIIKMILKFIIPLLFILLELYMMYYLLKNKPKPSIAGFLTILSGLIVYAFINKKNRTSENN
jgi:APA family basic amino acid/polyamine antiporter